VPRVDLATAASLLRAGDLVGIPTETVYGLAADATNAVAVRSVFTTKGRPADHPLIVHVLATSDAQLADPRARALAAALWPGPLTLVLPRDALGVVVSDAVTGGLPTVAVRAPAHPLARQLIAAVGRPLAAPSANRFGRTSPTSADHVLAEFPELPVLDGGPCDVGVESTIVDLTGPHAAILRPGGVPAALIAAIIGPLGAPGATRAPGTLRAHYAPHARVVATHDPDSVAATALAAGTRVAVLRADPDSAAHARRLYAALRDLDAAAELIVAEWAAPGGLGDAVNDRLRRAAAASLTGEEPHGPA
jgi:L-threonylcarbamoyladenylate synthase